MIEERVFGIGIDLGTSNSAISLLDVSAGTPDWRHARDLAGEREIASAVHLDTDGSPAYGNVAAHRQAFPEEAARVVANFKLLLRENQAIRVPGVGHVDPTELVHGFVSYLRQCFETEFHMPCSRAVVAVPAHSGFDVDYKTRVRQAVQNLPGKEPLFESLSTMAEPDAVLRSLVDLTPLYGKTVMVFDMGGGTLDVSVRQVDEVDGEVTLHHLAVDGSPAGGIRVTRALAEFVMEDWERRQGFSFTDDEREAAVSFNHFQVDDAKRRLSSLSAQHGFSSGSYFPVQMLVPGRGEGSFTSDVSVVDFTSLTRPVCEEALETVEKALVQAGLLPSEVDAYFMVGGSSRLPLMKQMLTELFGDRGPNPPTGHFTEVDQLLAVSKGAAYEDLVREERSTNVPGPVPALENKLPYSLSILVDDGTATSKLIAEGVLLPYGPVRREFFLPQADDKVKIVLMRGEGAPADCVQLSSRSLYLGAQRPQDWKLEVSLFIDENGELTLSGIGEDGEPIGVITDLRIDPRDEAS